MEGLPVTAPEAQTAEEVIDQTPANELPEADESTLENPEDVDAEQDPEFEEVTVKGNKYRVPKDLAPILQTAETLESGYQQKFRDVAEIRKAAESQMQQFYHEQQISSEITQEISQLTAVESRLSQYQTVDWQQWTGQDPAAAQAGMAEMMQLQNTYGQLRGHVDGRRAEISAIHEQRSATMISEAIEVLSKPDPDKGWAGNFDVPTKDSLTKFGRDLGYTDAQLAGTTDPLMIKTLNLAKIGYETLKKQKASMTPQKVVANPVPQVGAGASRSSINPDKLSDEQWVKWRDQQAKKAGYR